MEKLILQKIAFNNSGQDFLTFQVFTDQPEINLKGLEFFDDKVFKTVNFDFWVKNLNIVKLVFHSNEIDNSSNLTLYTDHPGLTSTTEQIILKRSDNYYDFFCWQKSPVSQIEIKQFAAIWRSDFWNDGDIKSCFASSLVKKEQSIIRISPEQKSSSWTIEKSQPTAKKSTSSANKKPASSANTIHLHPETTTPSPTVTFTEILPSPTDKKAGEWVEIHNLTDRPVNLHNWIIDDREGGSKPKRLSDSPVPANGYLVIQLKPLSITLNDSGDEIRLFHPDGSLETSQSLDQVESGKSYSLIFTDGKTKWQFTSILTPGQPNPIFTKIAGQIISDPTFEKTFSFQIATDSSQIYQVTFDESIVKAPLARATFKKTIRGEFTGIISDGINNGAPKTLQLNRFQISPKSKSENSPSSPLIVIILLTIGIGYFLLKKYSPWAHSQLGNY